ncbi:RM17 protein, partial [Nothoprocta pentlandii]|nr:RM17 protein [Nothoprocta pentlandii]
MRLSVAAAISHGRVHRRLGPGPRYRLDLLRNLVTALVRHERIEAPWARADEMRGYVERVSGGGGGGGDRARPRRAPPHGSVSPQLIDYAKRGDSDERAMRMADFWLTVSREQGLPWPWPWRRCRSCACRPQEKDLIHKLFKVLAPRYQPHPGKYTRMLQIPNRDSLDRAKMAVIELKGNPFPPLVRPQPDSEKTLLNQLLKGYREDVRRAARA